MKFRNIIRLLYCSHILASSINSHLHNSLLIGTKSDTQITKGDRLNKENLVANVSNFSEHLFSLLSGQGAVSPLGFVIAIFLIIFGLIAAFAGQNTLVPVLFITGFVIVSILTLNLISTIANQHFLSNKSDYPDMVYYALMILGGLIGGGVFVCLKSIAPYFFGGSLGYYLAQLLLSIPFAQSLNQTLQIAIIVAIVVFAVALTASHEKPVLILGTAFVGSYALFCGIDYFVASAFSSSIFTFARKGTITFTTSLCVMIAGYIATAIIGTMIQFKTIDYKFYHISSRTKARRNSNFGPSVEF